MKQEYKDWFLNDIKTKIFESTSYLRYSYGNRKYEHYNYDRSDIPFDDDFNEYLISLVGDSSFDYNIYHIHKWKPGYFFSEHNDNRDNRKFAYVCELQESECKTKLIVNGNPLTEGWFDVHTKHELPTILKGERISLTVFGKHKIETSII